MFELLHHGRVLLNTTSLVGPAKTCQKAYTMRCGPNMPQNSEKEKKQFFEHVTDYAKSSNRLTFFFQPSAVQKHIFSFM
jgi:hypothetical protein